MTIHVAVFSFLELGQAPTQLLAGEDDVVKEHAAEDEDERCALDREPLLVVREGDGALRRDDLDVQVTDANHVEHRFNRLRPSAQNKGMRDRGGRCYV